MNLNNFKFIKANDFDGLKSIASLLYLANSDFYNLFKKNDENIIDIIIDLSLIHI